MPKIGIIVVAAGSGSRMGGRVPKPFILLGKKPILVHTLNALDRSHLFAESVLVVSADRLSFVQKEFCPEWNIGKHWQVVPGGEQRQDSVARGLAALSSDCSYVLVHDGVRPFVPQTLLQGLITTVTAGRHCIAAIPAKDTLKKTDGTQIEHTVTRESVWLAQTPQAFVKQSLQQAYQKVAGTSFVATDESSVMEYVGETVTMVTGHPCNIKITTPEDLQLAEAILTHWKEL